MPRVIGIDPGTVSIDVCGLDDGRLTLDRAWPTAEALADPDAFAAYLRTAGEPDLIAGPSGYGLPLVRAADASDAEWRLAFLAPPGEAGGIGGLRRLVRRLTELRLPLVFLPGVVHLDTVPAHRKLNRVDLGTADKVCAAALGIADQMQRELAAPDAASFILLELGGAFTAAVAVERGQIVDGIGGTSGPLGWQAAGALDGEVAFLAGEVSKAMLFRGGVRTMIEANPLLRDTAVEALLEGAAKAVARLNVSAPEAREVLLSGRVAEDPALRAALADRLVARLPVRRLAGFAARAKQGAQGAAILADGLGGGSHARLMERLGIREAHGTVLDHLFVISPEQARSRLGLAGSA
ncbi:MAG TPA: DUF1464 family protein [Gemmatimonadales bacterium]|nr:DUF1464 family protein [Gemmatimonadales bacterium]